MELTNTAGLGPLVNTIPMRLFQQALIAWLKGGKSGHVAYDGVFLILFLTDRMLG